MVALAGLRGIFIGVWSITLLLDHMFVVFLFFEGAWSDTFDFSFTGFYAVVPYVTLEVQASLLLLLFL